MRVLRWLGIGLVGIGLLAGIAYALRTDPIAMMAGRGLSGEVSLVPVADWSFVEEHGTIAVESRPSNPHSVTTIAFHNGDTLYVPAMNGSSKSWPHYVVSDPRVRVKIGDTVYPALAERVLDPAAEPGLLAAAEARFGDRLPKSEDGETRFPQDVWVFKVRSAPADVAARGPDSLPVPAAPMPAVAAGPAADNRRTIFADIVGSPDRSEADRERDGTRKPVDLLDFAGVRPGMRVADVGAGEGYTAELLARVVGSEGTVYGHNTPGIIEKYVSKTWPARLEKPAMKNVVRVDAPFLKPLPTNGDLDLITMVFIYHDTLIAPVDRRAMNGNLFAALRPGGSLVIVDHVAEAGGDPGEVAKTLHRIEPSVVRKELLASGFQLADEGDFLANADDPRDAPFFRTEGPTDAFAHRYVRPR